MAFLTYTNLIQRVIRRLRMVPGYATQLYAEDVIGDMIQDVYGTVRQERWWDHLMYWETVELDGSTGVITTTLDNLREGFEDVQYIFYGTSNLPLPQLTSDINPYRLSGTTPRYVEPLAADDDPSGNLIFRVWPLESVATIADDNPLRVRVRRDPTNLFTDAQVVVPFDAMCLVNGAAHKYAAGDGTNPTQVEEFRVAFEARLKQLRARHSKAVIQLDPRMGDPHGLTEWAESR